MYDDREGESKEAGVRALLGEVAGVAATECVSTVSDDPLAMVSRFEEELVNRNTDFHSFPPNCVCAGVGVGLSIVSAGEGILRVIKMDVENSNS